MKNKSLNIMALSAALSLLWGVPVAYAETAMYESAQTAGSAMQETGKKITRLETLDQDGIVYLRISMDKPVKVLPASFTVASPPRIVFDFDGVTNGLGRTQQDIGLGEVTSANIVQADNKTRLVLNMVKPGMFDSRIEGGDLLIAISPAEINRSAKLGNSRLADSVTTFAPASDSIGIKSIRDVQFRRGQEGEARIVVDLSSSDTGIDIRQQGKELIVDFLNTSLPASLNRRSDVTDFGTVVSTIVTQPKGENTRLVVLPTGIWEHNAYQSDTQFVLEVRRVKEDPSKLVQAAGPGYHGEKLSLNFQNVDVRSVLQVIADFTDFNIVTSDSVQGQLTLRLQDVPWDQALDIILQSKGLDKRKNGNVIWIAPTDELQAREAMILENKDKLSSLEPLRTESFQVNYHKAGEIFNFLKQKDQTVLSTRGSVVFDDRSNKLFVTDVSARLDDVRRILGEIDISPRQVLIEARIVEAQKNFARDLGARIGIGGKGGSIIGYDKNGKAIRQTTIGGGLGATSSAAGSVSGVSDTLPSGLNVNLPSGASDSGALSMILWNSAATRYLNLELSALDVDGRGRIISSPKVLTANQVEAMIEQGTEIPYQEASSSGATSVSFKSAVLGLTVRPNITPDGRIQMSVTVQKDRPLYENQLLGVPPIETKTVKTEVLVNNGGTVVIGGIYEEENSERVSKIPFLGDIPFVGALFRNTSKVSSSQELLVFLTPRIVADDLTLRQ